MKLLQMIKDFFSKDTKPLVQQVNHIMDEEARIDRIEQEIKKELKKRKARKKKSDVSAG